MKTTSIIGVVGRLLLSLALIYGVYTETGIWTALFALLVTISLEFTALLFRLKR